MEWKNRILGLELRKSRDLLDHEGNWRIHPQHQTDALSGVLGEVGIVDALLVYDSERQGGLTIIDGHLRKSLDLETEWPCLLTDLTDAEADYVLVNFDWITYQAEAEKSKLSALLDSVKTSEAAVLESLNAMRDHFELPDPLYPAIEPGDVIEPDIPEALKAQERWNVAMGDIWECGQSWIGAGDCQDTDFIARLFGQRSPTFIWADPPYGIKIVNANGNVGSGKIAKASKYLAIENDDSVETAITSATHCLGQFKDAMQIWWGGNYYADRLPPSSGWLIWDKENTENNFADCELAWTNSSSAARLFRHQWNGMLKESERGERRFHPTQKPVALAHWAFVKFGNSSDIIYDPFLGSGISLLAAEQCQDSRIVIGCDIAPEYVAVTLSRWAELTEKQPKRLDL